VKHPQNGQTGTNGMSRFNTDQTGDSAFRVCFHQSCKKRREKNSSEHVKKEIEVIFLSLLQTCRVVDELKTIWILVDEAFDEVDLF
jgi:hypothetical protein